MDFKSVTDEQLMLGIAKGGMDELGELVQRHQDKALSLAYRTLGQTLKKLFTPNIEKALTFLDDSQLPSTSNAVERGYRQHRKMQKSVYRVRTQKHISQRIAIDMQRDEQAQGRLQTTQILHNVRNGIACSR